MNMMIRVCLVVLSFLLISNISFAQQGADTLHYKKIYYFAGTGLAIPLGKTKDVLSPKLFAGSMGLDISLKNPKYYLYPALYLLSFNYNQIEKDPKYDQMIKNGQSSMYMLSLSAGTRRQYERLNTYVYLGPTIGLVTEPRARTVAEETKIENLRSIALGTKIGIGADYKFKGFFLGSELGYMYSMNNIEGNSFHALTFLVGLKSDITRLSEKVVDILKTN